MTDATFFGLIKMQKSINIHIIWQNKWKKVEKGWIRVAKRVVDPPVARFDVIHEDIEFSSQFVHLLHVYIVLRVKFPSC